MDQNRYFYISPPPKKKSFLLHQPRQKFRHSIGFLSTNFTNVMVKCSACLPSNPSLNPAEVYYSFCSVILTENNENYRKRWWPILNRIQTRHIWVGSLYYDYFREHPRWHMTRMELKNMKRRRSLFWGKHLQEKGGRNNNNDDEYEFE